MRHRGGGVRAAGLVLVAALASACGGGAGAASAKQFCDDVVIFQKYQGGDLKDLKNFDRVVQGIDKLDHEAPHELKPDMDALAQSAQQTQSLLKKAGNDPRKQFGAVLGAAFMNDPQKGQAALDHINAFGKQKCGVDQLLSSSKDDSDSAASFETGDDNYGTLLQQDPNLKGLLITTGSGTFLGDTTVTASSDNFDLAAATRACNDLASTVYAKTPDAKIKIMRGTQVLVQGTQADGCKTQISGPGPARTTPASVQISDLKAALASNPSLRGSTFPSFGTATVGGAQHIDVTIDGLAVAKAMDVCRTVELVVSAHPGSAVIDVRGPHNQDLAHSDHPGGCAPAG